MGCNPFSYNLTDVFTRVCHSVHRGGGSMRDKGACMAGRGMHGGGGGRACPCHACFPATYAPCHACPSCHAPPYDMRSMSGQYTSYWNAFLFSMRTLSLASLQSCGNVDLDAWCKRTRRSLRIMLICFLGERFMFPWRIKYSRHKHCLNYCSCRFWLWIMEQFYLLYLSTDFRLSSEFCVYFMACQPYTIF